MEIIDFKDSLHWKLFDYLRNHGFQIAGHMGHVYNEYRPSVPLGLVLSEDEQVGELRRIFRLRTYRVFVGVIHLEYPQNGLLFELHDRKNLPMVKLLCSSLEKVFKIQITISIVPDGRRVESLAQGDRLPLFFSGKTPKGRD